jgi:hypothetical protein
MKPMRELQRPKNNNAQRPKLTVSFGNSPKRIFFMQSQTAAAHPAAELAGHARRRRMKTEKDSGYIPKLDTYALYPRSRAAGYYG